MIEVQQHPQGPRVFVLGRRIHEYMLGLGVVALLGAGSLARVLHPSLVVAAVAGLGVWLVAKDWRDMFPSRRDSASWRLGIHRRYTPLRPARQSEGLPAVAALLALAVAAVNLVSALTPSMPGRVRLLLQLEPVTVLPVFHALALPTAAALAVVAFYLRRRRRRALHAAIALLVAVGALNLLKGLDVEETALSWSLAGLLWWGRAAFYVRHEPLGPRSALWRLPLVALASGALALTAVWAALPGAGPELVLRETLAFLTWNRPPATVHEGFGWVPLGIGLLGLSGLLAVAYAFFRPLAVGRRLPDETARRAALELVRTHGRDTLAFFKLRADAHHFFSSDRRAFVTYRVENSVLVVSGDPVGAPEALPQLLRELCAFAERRGLRLGAVGAGKELLPLYAKAGLRAIYIGDEAVVETGGFSLEGRAIRKVRQSVSRLEKAGYTAAVHRLEELDAGTRAQLDRISARWRGGAPERGFAMAMDSIDGLHAAETAVVLARDGEGAVKGFLHFVPTYGRRAMSLSHMRRDPDTPNGLTEFLVVSSIVLLRERGIEELSLNFAAFARLLYAPAGRLERLLGRLLALAEPLFQIQSLYRFNAKFEPRWEPRYLLYERPLSLPRVALAVMRAEGQLPSPRLALPTFRRRS